MKRYGFKGSLSQLSLLWWPFSTVLLGQPSSLTLSELLSAPTSQRFLRFAIAMPIADPRNRERFPRQEKAMLHCDLRVRWKVASDLRFRAAISEPKTPSFCGISGDLAPSTRKSLAIAIMRFWCAKLSFHCVLVCCVPGVLPLHKNKRNSVASRGVPRGLSEKGHVFCLFETSQRTRRCS